jgi:hypothetical protein
MSSIVHKTLSLTPEVAQRLAAEANASALVERLLRAHYGMPPRPTLPDGRFTPENARGRRKKASDR